MDLLISARSLQLERQAELDMKLSRCECPNIIADYLLYRRFVNRQQYKSVHSGGFIDAYSNIQQNLKEIETDQKKLETILETEDPCGELKKYLLNQNTTDSAK